MMALIDRSLPDRRVRAGLLLGLALLLPSAGLRSLAFGRWLADPLPLLLAAGQLFRGSFAQLNWRLPLFCLLFVLLVALLAAAVAHWLGWHGPEEAGVVARTVMLLHVGLIAVRQSDALLVGLWYLIALFLSLALTASLANQCARLLGRAGRTRRAR